MPNTYTKLYVQLVFAVRGREHPVHNNIRDRIEKYITGIIQNKGQKLYAIYCMPDHLHILISIKPDVSLSDLVRIIKSESTKFINEHKLVAGKFAWQEGFGAFSYGYNQVDAIANYVLSQPEHHKKVSFRDEYVSLLNSFRIEYKDQYLFDWID